MSTLSLRKIKHDSAAVDNISLNTDGGVAIKGTPSTSYDLIVNGLGAQRVINTSGGRSRIELTSAGVISYDVGTNADASFSIKQNGGSDFLKIDSSGRLTLLNQPTFYANISSGYSISSGQTSALIFNNVVFNVGNHYNSSTNTFTAPIAGRYMFLTSVGGTGGMPANSYFGIAFRVNGSTQNAQWQNSASGYQVQKHSQIFNLSAGDTVTVWCEVASSFTVQNPFFQGILLA